MNCWKRQWIFVSECLRRTDMQLNISHSLWNETASTLIQLMYMMKQRITKLHFVRCIIGTNKSPRKSLTKKIVLMIPLLKRTLLLFQPIIWILIWKIIRGLFVIGNIQKLSRSIIYIDFIRKGRAEMLVFFVVCKVMFSDIFILINLIKKEEYLWHTLNILSPLILWMGH